MHANNSLAKLIVLNDLDRIPLIIQGKVEEAGKVAKDNYDKCRSRKKKIIVKLKYALFSHVMNNMDLLTNSNVQMGVKFTLDVKV